MDPEQDPYAFAPPGSKSISTYDVLIRIVLSSSKNRKKNYYSYCSLKNDVNAASESNMQKN
jgi:hypothetical protein